MRKRLRSLLALLLLLSLPLSAAAHPVPDERKDGHCSITVTMTYQEKALPGGTLALYKVGDVEEEDGNYSFVPVAAIREDLAQFGDIQSPELAGKLSKLEDKLPPVTPLPQKVEENGKVTFLELPFGLYLVVQKTAPAGYGKTEPFLVSLPYLEEGEYQYDVASQPKTDLERDVTTEPTTSPTTKPAASSGGKLPQTGQLWWPVPVLACGGLGCIVVGLIRKRRAGDED